MFLSLPILLPLIFFKRIKFILEQQNETRKKSSQLGKWKNANKYWTTWAYITGIGCLSFYSILTLLAYFNYIPNGLDILTGILFTLIFLILFFFIFFEMKEGKGKLIKYLNLPNFMIDRGDYNKQRPHPTKLKEIIELCINEKLEYKVDTIKYSEDRVFGWIFHFPNHDFHLDIEKVSIHNNDKFEFLIGPISNQNKVEVYKLIRKIDSTINKG